MFSGLESLEALHLTYSHLTTLPADVFSHLPRPLELGLQGNQRQCNAAVCWVKQEELQGTITIQHKPICANGVEWDSWTCDEGNVLLDPT